MSKLSQNWPQVRIIIYALLAVGLAVAVVAGWVSEEQSTNLLAQADRVLGLLGAAGLVFAASKVKTAAPTVDTPALADELATRINTGVTTTIDVAVSESEKFRRQVEQQLGHHLRTD